MVNPEYYHCVCVCVRTMKDNSAPLQRRMHVNMSNHERSASRTLKLYIAYAKFGSSLSHREVCGYHCAERGEQIDGQTNMMIL